MLDEVPNLTYRKLDYWRRTGRLEAHTHIGVGGGGIYFCWPREEVTAAALILTLTEAGFELESAAKMAHDPEKIHRLHTLLTEALAQFEERR